MPIRMFIAPSRDQLPPGSMASGSMAIALSDRRLFLSLPVVFPRTNRDVESIDPAYLVLAPSFLRFLSLSLSLSVFHLPDCGSCASLTLVMYNSSFAVQFIYFIKRSRNFGFAGQCFRSSFLVFLCLAFSSVFIPFLFSFVSFVIVSRFIFFSFTIEITSSTISELWSESILHCSSFLRHRYVFLCFFGTLDKRFYPETAIKHSPVDLSSLEI